MSALLRILALGRTGRRGLLAAVALGGAAAASSVALAATSAWLIARAAERPPVLHLMVAIVAVRAFGLARGILRYGERLTAHDASFRLLGDLRVAVVRRLERLLPGGRDQVPSGDLLARFVGDVDGLADLWVRVVLPAAVSTIVALSAIGFLTVVLPIAGIVVAAAVLLAATCSPLAAAAAARNAAERVGPLRARYRSAVLEVLDGAAELTVLGAMSERLAGLDAIDAALQQAERTGARAAGLGALLTTLAGGAGAVGALLVAAPEVRSGRLDPVLLAVVVLTPLALHEVIAGFAASGHELPMLRGRARRVVAVLDAPDTVPELTVGAASPPVPAGPLGVRVRDVSLGWPGGPVVVTGLELDVAAGERVAIVGPSGCGKSTLVAALLRFVEPLEGEIELVGGRGAVDVRRLDADDVRSTMAWCPQDPHVFDSTLAANLRIGNPAASPDELLAVLDRARLGDWVRSLPKGVDTLVGEHGRHLSGGERQRLALARVLLADRRIVLLDEPTEHVDDATAAALLDDALAALGGTTTILVTHRLDLLAAPLAAGRLDRVVDLAVRRPGARLAGRA